MLTLKQDGIEKVLQGKTDLAQVRAVAMWFTGGPRRIA
jgi:type II secretory ATPase GspE/PulE/Tfp pilus assembly ATPase PilB-like protein